MHFGESAGLQVSVPTANMEEIIPAARLLSRATALTPSDYERAKGAFLSGMDASSLAAQVRRGSVPASRRPSVLRLPDILNAHL